MSATIPAAGTIDAACRAQAPVVRTARRRARGQPIAAWHPIRGPVSLRTDGVTPRRPAGGLRARTQVRYLDHLASIILMIPRGVGLTHGLSGTIPRCFVGAGRR